MNLDGANDAYPIRSDDSRHDGKSVYDDRVPFSNGSGIVSGPPPPVSSYRSPYAETVHSQNTTHREPGNHSQYSELINPGTRRRNEIPSSAFQYGSGPLPAEGEPFLRTIHVDTATNNTGVNPSWLNELLTKAVKQGVEESRKTDALSKDTTGDAHQNYNMETSSQPPGAWPISPFKSATQPKVHASTSGLAARVYGEERDSAWGQSQAGREGRTARSRAGTRVTWNAGPALESSSNDGWKSHEETQSDSWDTDGTWTAKKDNGWHESGRKGRSRISIRSKSRAASPVTIRVRDRSRSRTVPSRRTRSTSRSWSSRKGELRKSSSGDNDGWTHVRSTSSSSASWENSDDTLQPEHSSSQVQTTRQERSRRRLRSKSTHGGRDRQSSQPLQQPFWQQGAVHTVPAPSVTTRHTPTVMNAPISTYSANAPSRRASLTTKAPSHMIPPPEWMKDLPARSRRASKVISHAQPVLYAPIIDAFARSTFNDHASASPLTWGNTKQKRAADTKKLWDKIADEDSNGDDGEESDWGKANSGNGKGDDWTTPHGKPTDTWETLEAATDTYASGWETGDNGWATDSKPKKLKDTVKFGDGWNDTTDTDDTWKVPKPSRSDKRNKWSASPPPTIHKPVAESSNSKRHSNKSLSKYRQLRSPSTDTTPKPHWQFPPPPPKKTPSIKSKKSGTVIAPKEPLYKISAKAASERGVEHQVRAGEGVQYGHVVGRPEYLDRLDKPVSKPHIPPCRLRSNTYDG